MIKKILATLVIIFIFSSGIYSVSASTSVKGYFKSNGTYVAPYFKSSPNKSKLDNYSTKGNINPYTGKKGYVDPYKLPKSSKTKSSSSTSSLLSCFALQDKIESEIRQEIQKSGGFGTNSQIMAMALKRMKEQNKDCY